MAEVTLRTVQGRFLLRPSARANDLIAGVVGRAQRRYQMTIHALVFLSNHAHMLVSPHSPHQLAAFMSYVAGNIARELGRLHSWNEKFWGRRYRSILISEEPAAQIARLAYVLGNSVKEGLVERPIQWPGIHCARALITGQPIVGIWIDRTAEYEARRTQKNDPASRFATTEQVVLSPLPCLAHLDAAAYRRFVSELVATLTAEAQNKAVGRGFMGETAILEQHPHDAPAHTDRSPAPLVHAATKAARIAIRQAYRSFVVAFREAARRLRLGDRMVQFPRGAFPPPLPFPSG